MSLYEKKPVYKVYNGSTLIGKTYKNGGNVGVSASLAELDPRRIPNLTAWLDAADSATLYDSNSGGSTITNNTGVGRWEDKSGKAFHVTQGTSGNRPVWKTNQQNGLPGLDFDGSNDFLYGNHNTCDTEVSLFAVASFFNNTNRYGLIDVGNQTSLLHFSIEQNTFLTAGQRYGLYCSGAAFDSETATSSGAKVFSVNATLSGAILSQTIYRVNSSTSALTLKSGATSYGNYSTVQGLMIGGFNSNGTAVIFFRGIAHEFIVYDRRLSAAEYTAVENYLSAKWAIT